MLCELGHEGYTDQLTSMGCYLSSRFFLHRQKCLGDCQHRSISLRDPSDIKLNMASYRRGELPLTDRSIGFIGLGAMGKPMIQNLASKLPLTSTVFVHDVDDRAVDEVIKWSIGRLGTTESRSFCKGDHAKDITEECVSLLISHLSTSDMWSWTNRS